MIDFLSEDWIDALDRAALARQPMSELAGIEPLVIEQVVTEAGGGAPVVYHLVLEEGSVRVRSGRAEQPDVTFTLDRETARGVSKGELSAQSAFMTGRLRIGGDAMMLVACQPALATLGDLFDAVRTETAY